MIKKALCRFFIVFCACIVSFAPQSAAQTPNTALPGSLPDRHRGAVTALLLDDYGNIFSAGEDGFVSLWNGQAIEERHQISRYEIRDFVLRPGKTQIAVIERGGFDLYRISAWDYETRENLFTLRLRDPITYINYSAAGGFLILGRGGARAGVFFLHPETGQVIDSPEALSGTVAFAATGRTERVMISYRTSGLLSYWDVGTGEELHRFEVPPNIRSPVLFGNNRFLGGFDAHGLLVIDAADGSVIARNTAISGGTIFTGSGDAVDARGFVRFYSLSLTRGTYTVYRMEINLDGRLSVLNRRPIPAAAGRITSVTAGNGDDIILGTSDGILWLLGRTGARAMNAGSTRRILYAAASSSAIAFMCENRTLGYIPLDFSLFSNNAVLTLEEAGAHTRIAPQPPEAGTSSFESRFLFWQPGAAASVPVLKTLSGPPKAASPSRLPLEQLPRIPLRSAAVMGNSLLFLNTTGALSVLDRQSGALRFSHSLPGALDAAFKDEDTIIFARSAVAGNTPFFMISISTGETVPLAYPAVVGTRVYRGPDGAVFGAVINQAGDNLQTSIIRLNTSAPLQSERLVVYSGEDPYFTLAESGGNLASNLGSAEALLYTGREIIPMERSRGLPLNIINGGSWFIVLDGDGSLSWHDNQTGRLLAAFRLEPGRWVLERGREVLSGRIVL